MSAGNKTLRFELGLSTLKAKREVKDFVRDANRQLKTLTADLGTKSRGGRSPISAPIEKAKKEVKDLKSLLDKALVGVDRVSVRYGNALSGQVKAIEREIRNAHKSLDSGRMSSRTFSKYVMERIKSLNDYGAAIKRLDHDIEASHDRQRQAAEKTVAKDKQVEKDRAATVKRIRQQAVADLNKIEISRGVTDLATRARYMKQLENVMQNAHKREIGDTKIAVQLMIAEYRKLAQVNVQGVRSNSRDEMSRQNATAKQMSRNMVIMFNAQQVMEDFSFAGLRGVGNNLAFMASMIGGPAGIVAMLGLMAVSLPSVADQLGFWGEEVGKVNGKLKDQLDLLRRLDRERLSDTTSFRFQEVSGLDGSSMKRDIRNDEARLDDINAEVSEYMKYERLLRDIEALKKNIATYDDLILSVQQSDPEGIDRTLPGRVADLKAERSKYIDTRNAKAEELERLRPDLGTAESFLTSDNTEAIKSEREKNKASRADLVSAERAIERKKAELKRLEASGLLGAAKRFDGLNEHRLDIPELNDNASKSSKLSKRFRGMIDGDNDTREKRFEDEKKAVLDAAENAKMDGRYRDAAMILDQFVEKEKGLVEVEKHRAEWLKQIFNTYGDTAHLADQLAESSEKLAENAERRAKAAQEEAKSLGEAKLASHRGFESKMFSAQSGVIDLRAENEAEARKARDKQFLQGMFGGAVASGNVTESDLNDLASRRAQMIDEQVESGRRQSHRAALNQRSNVLQKQTDTQVKSGNIEAGRESLQELQSLMFSAAGSAATPQEAVQYLHRAAEIQKQIEGLYEKQKAMKEQEAAAYEKAAEMANAIRDAAIKAKNELESIDPNKNGAMDKLKQMAVTLEGMVRSAQQISGMKFGDEESLGTGVELPSADGQQVGGLTLPKSVVGQSAMASVNNSRSVSSSTVNHINVDKVVTASSTRGSLIEELARSAKSRDIQMG